MAKGRRACLVIDSRDFGALKGDLLKANYEFHTGPRLKRTSEIGAMRAFLGNDRQVHVQFVRRRDGDIGVYAHTEPETEDLIAHGWAAMTGNVSYQGGARVLKEDLREADWDV